MDTGNSIKVIKQVFLNFLYLSLALYLPSALLEPVLFYYIIDINYFLSFFIGFFFNLCLYIYTDQFRLFFILNLLLYMYLFSVAAARLFYFNVFEYFARWRYIFLLDSSLVFRVVLLLLIASGIIYLTSRFQEKMVVNIRRQQKWTIAISLMLFFVITVIIRPSYTYRNVFKFQASHFGFGHELKRDYHNYFTDFRFENLPGKKSLTVQHFYNDSGRKDFLLMMESWGKLENRNDSLLNNYIAELLTRYDFIAQNYTIHLDSTEFFGNSAAAEAREILNGKYESSYSYFMRAEHPAVAFNVVADKRAHHYFTIAGYASSRKFGANGSNVYQFRKKLGFDEIYCYEDLKNLENLNRAMRGYSSVYDEIMLDTLLYHMQQHSKAFGYACTTNTHFPFNYDSENPYIKRFLTDTLVSQIRSLKLTPYTVEFLTRVFSTIDYFFYVLNRDKIRIDKIIIVGDHKYPTIKEFSNAVVPALIIEAKNKR